MLPLNEQVKITKVADYTAAGTDAINCTGVDMAGYQGVLFITSFNPAAANNTANAAQSANDSSYTDLTGTSVASGTSDEDVWIDVYHPTDRYVRLEIARGTSAALDGAWAIQYGARKQPVDNTTTGTIVGEEHVGEAEGTA